MRNEKPKMQGFTLRAKSTESACSQAVCCLCGNLLDPGDTTVELFNAGGERLGIVCQPCLAGGDRGAAKRARDHAKRLRKWAAALERVARALAKHPGLIPEQALGTRGV